MNKNHRQGPVVLINKKLMIKMQEKVRDINARILKSWEHLIQLKSIQQQKIVFAILQSAFTIYSINKTTKMVSQKSLNCTYSFCQVHAHLIWSYTHETLHQNPAFKFQDLSQLVHGATQF